MKTSMRRVCTSCRSHSNNLVHCPTPTIRGARRTVFILMASSHASHSPPQLSSLYKRQIQAGKVLSPNHRQLRRTDEIRLYYRCARIPENPEGFDLRDDAGSYG